MFTVETWVPGKSVISWLVEVSFVCHAFLDDRTGRCSEWVTMLLLVCSAGPSTFSRPTSSTPWGWEPSWAPPRAVSFQYIFLSRPGYVALVNYPMGFSFSKCSCISASCAAWIHGISWIPRCCGAPPVCICCDTCCIARTSHQQPWPQCLFHPKTSICTAWSTRSPAHNGWPDTRSLQLPSVCCPQPGTPPALALAKPPHNSLVIRCGSGRLPQLLATKSPTTLYRC